MKTCFTVSVICFLAGIKGYSSAERIYNNAEDKQNVIEPPRYSFQGSSDSLLYLDEGKQEQISFLDRPLKEENDYNGNSDDDDDDDDIDRDTEMGSESLPNYRTKRQAEDHASELALSHLDFHGVDRPVGQIFPRVKVFGPGTDPKNSNLHVGAGAGSVVWRSKNNRHSVGVGAFGTQSRGRIQGFRYKTKPDVRAGVGYTFKF